MRAMFTWLLAMTLTAVLVDVARRVAPVIGLVDTPNDRKSHQGETPLVGGIAIFACLLLAAAFSGLLGEHWAFLVAASLIVSVGVWDDVYGISPIIRLALQAGAVLVMVFFGDAILVDLGNILPGGGEFRLGLMAIPFTVFAGVGIINAFNMADGVDGLCGTLTLVALTGLGIVSALAAKQAELALILVLAGGLVGFLLFNVRIPGRTHAKAFLGDAGSYLLGVSVLYLTIRLSQGPDRAVAPVAALWFCMLPLFDTVGMIMRRLKRGRSPFSPDREHLHHVFLLAKFSVTETWIGLAAVALIGMFVGLAGSIAGASQFVMAVAFMGAGFLYYWAIMRAWKVMRFLNRSINRRVDTIEDRRLGPDRRHRTEVCYIDGIPVERRTGLDRRHASDERRHEEEFQTDNIAAISRKQSADKPGSRAARVS